jgi:hypothetical protein
MKETQHQKPQREAPCPAERVLLLVLRFPQLFWILKL